jgi:hypothetical protein
MAHLTSVYNGKSSPIYHKILGLMLYSPVATYPAGAFITLLSSLQYLGNSSPLFRDQRQYRIHTVINNYITTYW